MLLWKVLFVVAACASLFFEGCLGKGNTFEFCSRILALQETSELGLETAPLTFGTSAADPIGCINRDESLGPKDGFQVSSCQQSSVELNGLKSVFVLKLELDDRKGTLRAFESNTKDKAICFQHNVPMGESEFADDSPRCFDARGGKLVMFVTKTCPKALNECVNNWLMASKGRCDGTGPATVKEKRADAKLPSKTAQETARTRAPPPPRKSSPTQAPPTLPPGAEPNPVISLPPQSLQPTGFLLGTPVVESGPTFTVPPRSTPPLLPSELPVTDIVLPPEGGAPSLGSQLPGRISLPGPVDVPTPGDLQGSINPDTPQNLPGGLVPGLLTVPPRGSTGRGKLPEDSAPGGQIPLEQGQAPLPSQGGTPADLTQIPVQSGGAVPGSIQNLVGDVNEELAIDLCFRVYSTTHLVDRTTCTGFGPYEDPIRCIEDGQAFNPDTGIAYTPCADFRVRLAPGDTKALFNMTIGDRPGKITARLSKSLDEPRPVCLFVKVEGDGVFPEEDEAGCLHPWEPVSMFIGKTCRTKSVCSYHSLMVAGGGCLAPRILPEVELEDLPKRQGDLVAGFGEIGSEERYETPDGLVSQWIRCPAQTGEGNEGAHTPDVEIDSNELEFDDVVELGGGAKPPTIKSKQMKQKGRTKPSTPAKASVKQKAKKTKEEKGKGEGEGESSLAGVVVGGTPPIITSRSKVPANPGPKSKKRPDKEGGDD